MNKLRFIALITATVLLTTFLCFPLSAISIPQPSECFYVYDGADVISDDTEEHIIAQNDRLFYSTGSQIVVATLETIEDANIRDYSKKLFTEWHIGDTETQNGILILITTDTNYYWVLPGVGIDEHLTSPAIQSMLDDYLQPYMITNNYDKGVRTFFDHLIAAVADIYDKDLSEVELPDGGVDPYGNPRDSEESSVGSVIITIFLVIIAVAIVAVLALIIYKNLSDRKYRKSNHRPIVNISPGAAGLPQKDPRRQKPVAPRQGQGMPRQGQPMPRQGQPMPRQGQPMPRQRQPMPRQGQPMPRQGQPMPRQGQPMPRQGQPIPRQGQPMPRQNTENRNTDR